MNADQLLELYDRVAEAPDAIPHLRRFVLDLAVRGKLVEQDEADEPILQYLTNNIELDAKARKSLKALPSDACGGPLPASWVWLPLGSIIRGMDAGWSPQCESFPREKEDEWAVLRTTAVQQLRFDSSENKRLPEKLNPRPQYEAEVGDILITRAGPKNRVGVSCVVDVPCPRLMISDKLIRFHAVGTISARYVALTLNAGFTLEQIEAAKSGMAVMQMNISQDKLRSVSLPLPPLAEQQRIVAKVDELMALLDRLEQARAGREALRDQLTAATLNRLTQTDPEDFQPATHFALQTLSHLTTRPDQIKTLRQTILNLAVRGKLVEQDATDEPASELLKRIAIEKAHRRSTGEKRKETELKRFDGSEAPFSLPTGWQWVPMGELGETNVGLTYSPSDLAESGTPVLRSSNIQNGRLDLADLVRVKTSPKESTMVEDGDLLICARNGSRSLVGKVAIIENLHEPSAFGAFMAIFRSEVNKYLYVFISSPLFRSVIDEVNTTTINQITQNNLRSTLAPIPPLAEQHRIVARVDALMALCDQLEAGLTQAASTRTRLLDALLHAALHPAPRDAAARSGQPRPPRAARPIADGR